MTTTAISLADLAEATDHYLATEVEVRIGDVTRNLNPGGDGTFTVRVRNADAPQGIRLHDITVHLFVGSDAVLTLGADVSTMLEARASGSRSDALLPRTADVASMYVFFPEDALGLPLSDVLEPGEEIEFIVSYHAEGRGETTINAHVHASFSTADLFPRTSGPDTGKPVEIG